MSQVFCDDRLFTQIPAPQMEKPTGMKNLTNRPLVKRFLPHWQKFMDARGPAETLRWLENGKYNYINAKDAKGIIQALGLKK